MQTGLGSTQLRYIIIPIMKPSIYIDYPAAEWDVLPF